MLADNFTRIGYLWIILVSIALFKYITCTILPSNHEYLLTTVVICSIWWFANNWRICLSYESGGFHASCLDWILMTHHMGLVQYPIISKSLKAGAQCVPVAMYSAVEVFVNTQSTAIQTPIMHSDMIVSIIHRVALYLLLTYISNTQVGLVIGLVSMFETICILSNCTVPFSRY